MDATKLAETIARLNDLLATLTPAAPTAAPVQAPAAPTANVWTDDKIVRWVDRMGRGRNSHGIPDVAGMTDPDGLLAIYALDPGHPVFTAAYPKSATARAKHPDARIAGRLPAPVAPQAPAAQPTARERLLAQVAPAAPAAPAAPTVDPVVALLDSIKQLRALPNAQEVLFAVRMIHDAFAANRGPFTHADVDVALGFREPAK